MDAVERHRRILARLEADQSAKVSELATDLGVAAVTVRNDVRELARRGLVRRVHGGATRIEVGTEPLHSDHTTLDDSALSDHGTPAPSSGVALGVVVPNPSYYYPDLVAGARTRAEGSGAKLVLAVSQNDPREERVLVDRLIASGIDGLILATALDPQRSVSTDAWLAGLTVPVVLAERRAGWQSAQVEHVASDHEQGAHDAVRHIASLGRRRIGLVHVDTITAPRVRVGYDVALEALGLPTLFGVDDELVVDESPASLDAMAARLVTAIRQEGLDGLLIHHDLIALPLVSRLRQAGIRIPEDLVVVTHDDVVAALSDPPLSAVAPPRREVGAEAVDTLIDRLADPDRPIRRVLLRPWLRIRASSEPSAAGSADLSH